MGPAARTVARHPSARSEDFELFEIVVDGLAPLKQQGGDLTRNRGDPAVEELSHRHPDSADPGDLRQLEGDL